MPEKRDIFSFFFLILTIWEHLSTEWYGSHWYILLMWLCTAWGDIFLKLEVHSFKNFYREVHWFLIVIIFFKFKNTALHFLFLYFLIDKATVVMPYNAVSIGHIYKTYPKVPEKLSWVFQSGRGFMLVWYSGIWLSCCDILPLLSDRNLEVPFSLSQKRFEMASCLCLAQLSFWNYWGIVY